MPKTILVAVVVLIASFAPTSSRAADQQLSFAPEWPIERVGQGPLGVNWISKAAISPDARKIAFFGGQGLQFRNAITNEPIGKAINNEHLKVDWITWSGDGRFVATSDTYGTLIWWNAQTRKPVWKIATGCYILMIAVNPEGTRIATGGHQVRVWDSKNGKETSESIAGRSGDCASEPPTISKEISGLAYADGGKTLLSSSRDGVVAIRDESGKAIRPPIRTTSPWATLVSNPRQPVFAIVNDGSIEFWNYRTGVSAANSIRIVASTTSSGQPASSATENKRVFMGPSISSLSFSEDGERILVSESAGTVAMIDWRTGKVIARGMLDPDQSIAVSANEKLFVTIGRTLAIWKPRAPVLSSGMSVREISTAPAPNLNGWLSPDNNYVTHFGKQLEMLDLMDRRSRAVLLKGASDLRALGFSPDSQRFAYAQSTQAATTVSIFHLPTRRVSATIRLEGALQRSAFSPDGKRLAVLLRFDLANFDDRERYRGIVMIDTSTGGVVGRFEMARRKVPIGGWWDAALTFSPDGKILLAARNGDDVTRIDTSTMKALGGVWPGLGENPIFSADGKRIASYHSNSGIVIVDATSGAQLLRLAHEADDFFGSSIAFTPDNRFLLLITRKSITLWDAINGKRLARQVVPSGLSDPSLASGPKADAPGLFSAPFRSNFSRTGNAPEMISWKGWEIVIDTSKIQRQKLQSPAPGFNPTTSERK